MTQRLDVALQQAGLARSRTHARRIIEEGRARIDGQPARRVSQSVEETARLEVVDVPDGREYASRAAHKLAGALAQLGVDPLGRRCLDAGASTGGFTDVLLRRGAASVAAVDIGTGQLAAHLRADERVHVHDATSIRGLDPERLGGPVDLTVADLSFISLRTVLGDLARATTPPGDLVLMVKPQFEVGRERLPRGGVVRSAADRRDAVRAVVETAAAEGLRLCGAGVSELPGQDGNIELFVHFRSTAPTGADRPRTPCTVDAEAYDMIDQAIARTR